MREGGDQGFLIDEDGAHIVENRGSGASVRTERIPTGAVAGPIAASLVN